MCVDGGGMIHQEMSRECKEDDSTRTCVCLFTLRGCYKALCFSTTFLTYIDCAFRKGNATQKRDAAGPKTSYFL